VIIPNSEAPTELRLARIRTTYHNKQALQNLARLLGMSGYSNLAKGDLAIEVAKKQVQILRKYGEHL
jgi:pyruvate kinase